MRFERFATFAAMQDFAVALADKAEEKVWVDYGAYSDDNGISYRPQVFLVTEKETVTLRWNAFTEEAVSYFGPKMRREANIAAEKLALQLRDAMAQF